MAARSSTSKSTLTNILSTGIDLVTGFPSGNLLSDDVRRLESMRWTPNQIQQERALAVDTIENSRYLTNAVPLAQLASSVAVGFSLFPENYSSLGFWQTATIGVSGLLLKAGTYYLGKSTLTSNQNLIYSVGS